MHHLRKRYLLLLYSTDFPEMSLISNTSKSFRQQTCGQGENNTLHHFITYSPNKGPIYLPRFPELKRIFNRINKIKVKKLKVTLIY